MNSPRNLASNSENALAPAKNGRPEVLDQSKRAYVCRLIGMGYTRRMAARQVQCSHTTIARTAARDPLFALDLANAETEVDGEALRLVRAAAREQKYWRAAAWLLERRNPEEYGRRTAHAFSGDQVMAMLAQIFSDTLPRLPAEEKEGFLRLMGLVVRNVEAETEHADRWRRMASADNARSCGDQPELRSPYEHPEWSAPAALDAAEEDYAPPEEQLVVQVSCLPENPVQARLPENPVRVSRLPFAAEAAEPRDTEAPQAILARPDASSAEAEAEEEGVSFQLCPDCQESNLCSRARKLLSDNDLCQRQTYAPSAQKREAVQKSGLAADAGGPLRPFLSVR